MSSKTKLSPPVQVNEPRDPRRNALVHGLTANFPLDDQEHQILAEEIDVWTKELAPVVEAETALIHAAAIARVRQFRCARAEAAALRLARKHAEAKHREQLQKKARKLAQSFPADPADTLDRLEATHAGRDYLVGRWRALDATLAQGLALSDAQRDQFMYLMGYQAQAPGADAPMFCRELWANLLVAHNPGLRFQGGGTLPEITRKLLLHGFVPPPDLPADEFAARKFLRDLCGNERLHLDQLEREAAEDTEAQEQEAWEAAQRAELTLVQTDPQSLLRQRYAREADQSARSNINQLRQIRRDRHKQEQDERKEAYRKPPRDPYPPPRYRNEPDPKATNADATPKQPSTSAHNTPPQTTPIPSAPNQKTNPDHPSASRPTERTTGATAVP